MNKYAYLFGFVQNDQKVTRRCENIVIIGIDKCIKSVYNVCIITRYRA